MTETTERKGVLVCTFKMFNPSLLNSMGLGKMLCGAIGSKPRGQQAIGTEMPKPLSTHIMAP